MGLYYRKSDKTDICLAGNVSPGSDSGFNEIIADNKSLLASTIQKIKFTAGENITLEANPTTNEIKIGSTASGTIISASEPEQKENEFWMQPY